MKKIILLPILLALFATSCKKGCTDSDATNYDSKAKRNDNSCKFETKILFWQNQQAAQAQVTAGATTLHFYINGELVGTRAANEYFTAAPDCDQNGTLTIRQDLGKEKSWTFTFQVKDQTGFVTYEGTHTASAGVCNAIELSM